MQDHQSHFYHEFQNNRQDWAISAWAKKLGISVSKLENHPYIEDIALLLDFDQHQLWFTQKDTDIWTHCWQWCYKHEHQLNKYHKNKLLSIIDGIEYRRQQYLNRQQKRQHIQQRIEKRKQKLAAV